MKALKVMVLGLFCYVLSTPSIASELVQEFSNPSFSGNGYSTHVLSLEQLRYSRENKIKDDQKSADAAAKRHSGVLVRRFLVVATVFAIVVAPFVFAWTDVGVSVARETNGFLGFFKTVKWETVQGFVILPEIRQTALAIVGFYFGSSQIK